MFEVTSGFHSGPFHRAEPLPALAAYYLHLRRARKLPAARALRCAKEDSASAAKLGGHAPTLRALFHAGNWQSLDDMPRHSARSARAYYCDALPAGWRDGRDSHDVAREDGTRFDSRGWYGDSDCGQAGGGVFIGVVCQLPARRGVCQYVPAVRNTDSVGWTLYPLDLHDSALECARAADEWAARAAMDSRDYFDAWHAGVQYANKVQESRDAWAEAKQAARDWRGDRAEFIAAGLALGAPSVQRTRARYLDIVERAAKDSAAAREAAAEIMAPYGRGPLAGGFRDGADLPAVAQ